MTTSLQIVLALAGYFIFSAAVGAMSEPAPAQKDSFYGWLYRFLQTLAANAALVARARFGINSPADAASDLAGDAAKSK